MRSGTSHRPPCRTGAALLVLALAALAGCGGTRPPGLPADPRFGDAVGAASYYADRFHGRRTANGERYDRSALTAAHRTLPFGTRVRVTNLENGRRVVVRITDRGPHRGGRLIDVSRAAARALGFTAAGLARVRLEVVAGRDGS